MTLASLPEASAPASAFLLFAALLVMAPARAQGPGLKTWEPLAIATHQGVRRFTVEIADTDATREKGLMFRKHLAPDRGMLFDFKAMPQRLVAFPG